MNFQSLSFLLLGIALSWSLYSHARLADNSDVTPRGLAMKNSPCGENTRSATAKTLTAGSQITVRWIETVDHTGSYWIEFSRANDTDWVRLKTIVDDQNNPATLPHLYVSTITVPNVNCSDCTIRLVQEMTDGNPASPTYYFSCGDIKIINAKC